MAKGNAESRQYVAESKQYVEKENVKIKKILLVLSTICILSFMGCGVFLLSIDKDIAGYALLISIITNPNIIAVILGMVLFLLELSLPQFLTDAVGFVGNATTPLSIICIGYMLSQAKLIKVFKKWKLMVTAVIQLIIGPLITWGILTLCQFPTEVVQVCTLIQALPTATSLGLFAVKYGGNAAESSELVTISTILSVATMPFMVFILLGS